MSGSMETIKKEIIRSAQIAKDAGATIPDSIGFSFNKEDGTFAPINGGVKPKAIPGVAVIPHWYIRHGSIDRDTAFPIALNLSVKAKNLGKDVNYLLAWNRPHSGDYALNELFNWLDAITGNKK